MRRGLLAAASVALAIAVGAPAANGSPPPVQATSYFVLGGPDGAVLAERGADLQRAPASITKLMTVLVALEHARLDDIVTVSPQATRIGEATIHLRAGEHISVRDLAIGALVPSANDAATALAVHVGKGSIPRFVALMNAKARTLGLRDTQFANPHGLDQAGHVSSARDVVVLLRAALRNAFIRTWASRRSATLAGGRVVDSTDDLLGRLPVVGAKTGHTDDAGWSQVAAIERGGVRVTASVLGSPSEAQRNDDLEALLLWGLTRYRSVRAVDAARTYALARTGYGRPLIRAVAARTVVRNIGVDHPLVEKVVAVSAVSLPVVAGMRLGEVRVYDGTRLVAQAPLIADRPASSPGTLAKIGWYARRTVHHFVGLVS
jgi:D-alanyl-D-alanine carboxypeptidase